MSTLHEPWVFGQLAVKGDSITEPPDFFELGLGWVHADDSGQAIDRLEEMLADSTVSYPAEYAESREGFFDDSMVYLVYERADVEQLLAALGVSDG